MDTTGAKKILLVDDDPYIRDAVSRMLTEKKYYVIACSNAHEALAGMKGNSVDIVLSDNKMPEVSGFDLLERIHKINSRLPVILMTAFADLEMAVDALKRGAFDFIIKPYHREYLLHSVKKAFQYGNYLRLKENYNLYLEDLVK